MSFIAKHNDMVKNAPSPTSTTLLLHRIVIACLMVIIILQYSVIHNAHVEDPNPIAPPNAEASDKATAPQARIDDTNATLICATAAPPRPLPAPHKAYEGVAVTTFLGAPKWFQNRYTLMVNQVLAMIEDDWIVQIFYDPAVKMAREGIAYPGIQRQILRGRVLLTPLPSSMKKIKKNNLLLSSWFWSNIVAENVLLFGGTAALCANTNLEVSNFTGRYDYIGTPWGQFNGQGGEGGISLRNRTVMQGIVQRYEREMQEQGRAMGAAKEDSVIVRSLLEQKGRLATKEVTYVASCIVMYMGGFSLVDCLCCQGDVHGLQTCC